jgi:haloacetate dehalogenase
MRNKLNDVPHRNGLSSMERHMREGLIDGFKRVKVPGDGVQIDALVAGSGAPVLLLHGAPQTRVVWRHVAPVLVPDLRGYGRSDKPPGGGDFSTYSKRALARDQVATMRHLGFETFALAGHDRGGRVAYRLALDHPGTVTRLALLDIVPTLDAMEAFDQKAATKLWHWAFQAQAFPFPEHMIGLDPDFYVRMQLRQHAGEGFAFDESNLEDYLSSLRDPAAVHAMCEDYRAAWTIDRQFDEEDRGKKKILAPVLVLWGAMTVAAKSPLTKWQAWADNLQGESLTCGHFLPEEKPAETAAKLLAFFS